MTNKIGEKIRHLRKKADVTQEKLAEYLGITFQAVSRWESGACYPDLEMLPAIANFFGVTTDELLGVDASRKAERLDSIREQTRKNFAKGLIDENIALCRTAANEFPNEFALLSDLAFYLGVRGNTKNDTQALNESLSVYERIMADCPDEKIRYSVIQHLAYRYKETGEKEKAVEIAQRLPHTSRDTLLCQIYEGKELIEHLKNHIMNLCDLIKRDIVILAWENYNDNTDTFGLQKRNDVLEKAIGMFKLIFEDGSLGFYHMRMEELYEMQALNYMYQNNHEYALVCIEKAADHSIAFDTLPEEYTHTSMLFEDLKFCKASDMSKDYAYNDSYQMLHRWLANRVYDPIRETERFQAIAAKLEQYAVQGV